MSITACFVLCSIQSKCWECFYNSRTWTRGLLRVKKLFFNYVAEKCLFPFTAIGSSSTKIKPIKSAPAYFNLIIFLWPAYTLHLVVKFRTLNGSLFSSNPLLLRLRHYNFKIFRLQIFPIFHYFNNSFWGYFNLLSFGVNLFVWFLHWALPTAHVMYTTWLKLPIISNYLSWVEIISKLFSLPSSKPQTVFLCVLKI